MQFTIFSSGHLSNIIKAIIIFNIYRLYLGKWNLVCVTHEILFASYQLQKFDGMKI
jgi:hypothetical protein